MPLVIKQYESVLNSEGFTLVEEEETKKRAPYINESHEVIYINKSNIHLTIDPKHIGILGELKGIHGVTHRPGKAGPFSHGSNMYRFGKRQNTGKDKIPGGLAFEFDTMKAMREFLNILGAI